MSRLKRKVGKHERGVALMMVMLMVALVTSVAMEFQFTSQVDFRLAVNARDSLQAEYNALSALRLRAVVLRQARKINAAMSALSSAAGLNQSMIPPVGKILELVPIECGIMSAVLQEADISASLDERADDEQPMFPGDCVATATSEHSKIPINMLRNFNNNRSKQVTQLLVGMLSNPSFERHFQEDDRNGVHAENPVELVGAITDWIDQDDNQIINNVADESRPYDLLEDSYKIKNAPFDSLAELQLVHGVDDEMYDLLRKHVTIYSDGTQIDLSTAPVDRIWLGLLSMLPAGVDAQQLMANQGVAAMDQMLREATSLGAGLGVVNTAMLNELIASNGLSDLFPQTEIKRVFTDNSGSTWYSIEAQGRVGDAIKRIYAVFQASEGQFYYFRVE